MYTSSYTGVLYHIVKMHIEQKWKSKMFDQKEREMEN